MPRTPRIEFEGAVYHLLSRGDHGEAIFQDDADRRRFLDALAEACGKTGWVVHAYVLMPNHYHLLIETPQANLVDGMKWLQGTYTTRYNHRHDLHGHLFQGRYKPLLIEPGNDSYFLLVSTYIHLNPVWAGIVAPDRRAIERYAWSSFPAYVGRGGPDFRTRDCPDFRASENGTVPLAASKGQSENGTVPSAARKGERRVIDRPGLASVVCWPHSIWPTRRTAGMPTRPTWPIRLAQMACAGQRRS